MTEIGTLYKVSHLKLVLVFGTKMTREKLAGTEIQCRFGYSKICLNFRKEVGPFRNRETCFVCISVCV